MKILGIHDGHSASACVVQDGRVLAAAQEERFSREKNRGGSPKLAVDHVLKLAGLRPKDLDAVAFSTLLFKNREMVNRDDVMRVYGQMFAPAALRPRREGEEPDRLELQQHRAQFLIDQGVDPSRIQFVDHHTCHAATAYFGRGSSNHDVLVLTNDGQGDGLCGSVSVGRGRILTRLAEVPKSESVAAIYSFVTYLMGFTPLEHEYKLMGMAPYAERTQGAARICALLEGMFEEPANLVWHRRSDVPAMERVPPLLSDALRFERFDCIMAGLQLFTENFVTRWVENAVRETGIPDLAAAGGIFMNVKLNKRILELDSVRSAFFAPSCGDESNCLGAAWAIGAQADTAWDSAVHSLPDLYLGPSYTRRDVRSALDAFKFENRVSVTEPADIDEACAELLASDCVVARFSGRMEFGARALGNRSILANPSNPDACSTINKMIKMRDFWMPFAPAILEEHIEEYVKVGKCRCSPFMTLAYDVLPRAQRSLRAAIHAHDKTCRPQIVSREHNAAFHRLIGLFRERTGIAAIMNTSFNLHGYPIVTSPEDALRVFDSSGLTHLALEGFLISKEAR